MGMKRTLLELTQDILASMDGDEITTITDTAEAEQVANIARQAFYEIVSSYKLPEHYNILQLTETDATTPTLMYKPANCITFSWIKYNYIDTGETNPNFQEVAFLPKDDFLLMLDGLNVDDTNVSSYTYVTNAQNFPIKYINNKQPQFYTSFDDVSVLFDSVDEGLETFLRGAKTWCYGILEQTWTHSDSFVPPLDHRLSNLLFQKAKAQAMLELKQVESQVHFAKVRRSELTLLKDKNDIDADGKWRYYDTRRLPNFGRK